jgi:hypothetical protein
LQGYFSRKSLLRVEREATVSMDQHPGVTAQPQPARRLWLKAYSVGPTDGWSIEPAPVKREWMDATFQKNAYRCLPLVAANQAGWLVRCPANLTAEWSGRIDNYGVKIVYEPDSAHLTHVALSHFGSGILTFVLPWLLRTPPGIGLWIRGLANDVKADIVPLDGLVETDWSPFTFTVSWKIVRSGVPVHFRKGDPICMIQPFLLGLLDEFDCSIEPFSSAPAEIQKGFYDFVDKRAVSHSVAPQGGYEPHRDYFLGRYPDGSPARYPLGTDAPPTIGCPAEHRPPGNAGAASSTADAQPSPQHRMKFDVKPFT